MVLLVVVKLAREIKRALASAYCLYLEHYNSVLKITDEG